MTTNKPAPAEALRKEIARRRLQPAVLLSGLGPVLDLLEEYITDTEHEIARVRDRVLVLEAAEQQRMMESHR